MIKRLLIKNYAIIESVEIEYSDNLTIITGETGAGKSIMLGALGLIMGERADGKTLNNPNKKCIIEGYFDVLAYDLKGFFEEHDIDYDTEVVLRREITPSGKSRAFVNDSPVKLPILKALSLKLIDLHRQFDTLDIQNEAFQLRMIDALANNKKTLTAYKKLYTTFNKNTKLLQKLKDQSEKDAKEMDFLLFQLEELSTAAFDAEEQEQLESDLTTLTNAENIKQILSAAYSQLSESEVSVIGSLQDVSQQISQIAGFHKGLEKAYTRFEGLIYELEDLAGEFSSISEDTEFDQERITELTDRLDLIYRLQTKHKVVDIAGLLEIQASLEDQTKGFGDLTSQISQLEKTLEDQEHELREIAKILSERRQKKTGFFENKIHEMLGQLAMVHARLKIDITRLEDLTPTGFDQVNFLFSANKGGRMDLIKGVASGGELSRLALCTKSLVAGAIPLPTIIFDEIDSGVSGDVAQRMATILKKLSTDHQVVSITHTPQIAAKADKHFFVYKEVVGETTKSNVKLLNREERVQELAIMLSGNPPSEYAVSNAVDLLG
jgi:DNA repair protein RecN (Recombination protein N)